MSNSSDESELSPVLRTRKRVEPFNLHHVKDAPGATDRSVPAWKQRPSTTYIVSDIKSSEKLPYRKTLPPPVIEVSPPFTKTDRINANIKNHDKSSTNNNSDSDEMQHDKIWRGSYKNAKENIVDDDLALSTGTVDDTYITTKSFTHETEKIHHILKELITTEEHYIKKLESCVENYVKHVTNDHYLPVPLKGQQHLVFSEIEEILEFHKNIFYPALADCNYDLDKIIDRIRQYVQQDLFYPYVLYAMNKPKSARVVKRNQNYFTERQNVIGDRLGLASLLMEPIQRLPKYRLLIYEMIKDYMKNYLNKNTTSTMESLCRAEKELQRVLDAANESITLNDIVIDDFEINIHHQGKFIKSGNFEINDPKSNKKFSGKLFLFTYSLIYTEYSPSNKKKLIYRGCFDCSTLRVRQEANCEKISVFDMQTGQNEIEFECENNLENWYKILQSIMINGIIEGKPNNQMLRKSSSSLNSTTKANSIKRWPAIRGLRAARDSISVSSIISFSSNISDQLRFSNTSTLPSDIGSIRSSQSSTTSACRIPEDGIFDKIIYSENQYITYLTTLREVYLNSIDDNEIKQKLDRFCRNFEQILTYHQNEFYPKIFEFEMSYASLFNLYEMYLNSNILEANKNYAVVAADASDILKAWCKQEVLKSASSPIDVFVKLPIRRNKYYLSTVDHYIKKYMPGNYRDAELLEKAASLQSNFSRINKQIDETFKLYSIKQNKIKLHHYGGCEYSDIVSLVIFGPQNHRICIMEHGLICVKFKTIKDTNEEDYLEIVFGHPYSIKIHLRNSVKNANILHIDTVDQKSISPGLTFRSDNLKTKFSNLIGLKLENKTGNEYVDDTGPTEDEGEDDFSDKFYSEREEEGQCYQNAILPPSLQLDIGQARNVLKEIITTEEDYVKNLQSGMENYVTYMENNLTLPQELKKRKNQIFGVIDKIYEFHRNHFQPALLEANYDLDQYRDFGRKMRIED